jgi:hypothetical protein
VNKEPAIKRVREILIEWAYSPLLKLPSDIIVDAVIGELFGWKAKRPNDCADCRFYRLGDIFDHHCCDLQNYGWRATGCDLWPTCPKPKRLKREGTKREDKG